MLTLSRTHQCLIGAALVLLLIATRSEHFATLHSLPSASWAVFLLAGVYLRPVWVLPGLFALVWAMDFAPYLISDASLAEIIDGDQAFCLTPAYFFLLPAYGALWLAGRWFARRYRFEWRTLLPLTTAALAGAAVCDLFSSGGFYFYSGRFAAPTLTEFGARLVAYLPSMLASFAFYLGIAILVHVALVLIRGAHSARRVAESQ